VRSSHTFLSALFLPCWSHFSNLPLRVLHSAQLSCHTARSAQTFITTLACLPSHALSNALPWVRKARGCMFLADCMPGKARCFM
jgi:hypothetical protein